MKRRDKTGMDRRRPSRRVWRSAALAAVRAQRYADLAHGYEARLAMAATYPEQRAWREVAHGAWVAASWWFGSVRDRKGAAYCWGRARQVEVVRPVVKTGVDAQR